MTGINIPEFMHPIKSNNENYTHMFMGVDCTAYEYQELLNKFPLGSKVDKTAVEETLARVRPYMTGNETAEPEYTGGSSSYYLVHVAKPTTQGMPAYTAECNDIIEALKMNYAEGNAFKAIWRRRAAELGKLKKGYDNGLYDAEKVVFFGERMVVQSKAAKETPNV